MAIKVFLSDKFSPVCMETLQKYGFEVVDGSQETPTEEALIKVAKEFDAMAVRSRTKVRQPVLEQATQLKVIVRGGVGIDNIDHQFAKDKGIAVRNTPKASSNSVAELAIAHLFACLRFIPQGNAALKEGKWAKKN